LSAALPLEGIRVLDLSRVLAGPYATQLRGDLGAEVWKVERPGDGDETRAWGPPFVHGVSAYYLSVNRNKKSAALDFADPRHRDALLAAAAQCDVVVENFLPGHLERFGLDPRALRAAHPELIVCSITGFGQDGPYAMLPGYDVVLQGFTGLMSITGAADGPPMKVGVAAVDVLTGVHAAAAMLSALVGRLRGRGGCHLDVALFEVGVVSLVNVSQGALVTGQPARRHGNGHPHIVPYQTFEAQDAPMVLAIGNDAQWRTLCVALDRPEWAERVEWARNPDRVLRRAEVVAALAERFASAPRAHWLARLAAAGVPAGPLREMLEVVQDPALRARDMLRPAAAVGGDPDVELFGPPWRADAGAPLRLPPPALAPAEDHYPSIVLEAAS
jgi:crotonobetainyl-CoA:carnitine CoA-transferase CaiB-like acyl-CoA transferase